MLTDDNKSRAKSRLAMAAFMSLKSVSSRIQIPFQHFDVILQAADIN